MPLTIAIEAAGWLGAICVLGAYILLSAGRVTGNSIPFHGLNALGAAGFIVNTAWHGALPSVALNIIWLAVGIGSLARIMLASR